MLLIFGDEIIMEEILRKNPKMWMIVIYLFLVSGFLYMKPEVAFGQQGRVRPFGVGKKESTIFPVWWWMFVFAVVSYMSVVWLLNYDF
ncbi:MAG: hypothetical protein EB127_04255 [Alphaproteobacteria bacterium]|jgi:hypothetical protein|nr:hypothetical protein [Alphaproteobacteria bacterium]